ncbi:MAG: ThiF family adenylyltransferase [Bacteroidetes bacterium]|nr:ThiF family adenylyltransferase [Bacteroidota bacterium]
MQNSQNSEKVIFHPSIFDFNIPGKKEEFDSLHERFNFQILNTLAAQMEDLAEINFPEDAKKGVPPNELVNRLLNGKKIEDFGNLVYYPWKNSAAWILKEDYFSETRTNRNRNKITADIQQQLFQKHVLIIGLSVGQSAALAFAMQRICGHLHLADFDSLSLSNMNRLRASVLDINLPKTAIAARQIAEQDPYLQVHCFADGATAENLDALITRNGMGKVDLIVEECDSLEVKLMVRQKAKEYGVPVIMDTSDRGLMDIERFDLEKNRPLFHGLLEGEILPEPGEKLNPGRRFELLSKIVNISGVSRGMQISLPEIGKSLLTWPQLSYEVTLGGALTTYVGYKILAGEQMDSGRIYVDLEEIFKKKE